MKVACWNVLRYKVIIRDIERDLVLERKFFSVEDDAVLFFNTRLETLPETQSISLRREEYAEFC